MIRKKWKNLVFIEHFGLSRFSKLNNWTMPIQLCDAKNTFSCLRYNSTLLAASKTTFSYKRLSRPSYWSLCRLVDKNITKEEQSYLVRTPNIESEIKTFTMTKLKKWSVYGFFKLKNAYVTNREDQFHTRSWLTVARVWLRRYFKHLSFLSTIGILHLAFKTLSTIVTLKKSYFRDTYLKTCFQIAILNFPLLLFYKQCDLRSFENFSTFFKTQNNKLKFP